MPDRTTPIEGGGRDARVPRRDVRTAGSRPQNPRGEDPVEQRLHQRRTEEPPSAFALEPNPERFFQRRPHCIQRRSGACGFDPMQRVARIRGEQPRQIFRLGQGRAMRQGAAQIFAQPGASLPGEIARRFQPAGKLLRALRRPKRFEPGRLPVRVFADEHEVARIGDQYEPIPTPVPVDLLLGRGQESVVIHALHFHHAAFWGLALLRLAPLHLLGGV